MTDIKSFFHAWCNKTKVEPQYESRPTGKCKTYYVLFILTWPYRLGPKHRQRFLCELRVPGFNYVGAGNSTVKKDAEKNASRDFVNFLVRNGTIFAADVPGDAVDNLNANIPSLPPLMGINRSNQVFKVCTTADCKM